MRFAAVQRLLRATVEDVVAAVGSDSEASAVCATVLELLLAAISVA